VLTIRRTRNILEVVVKNASIDDDLHVRLQRHRPRHALCFSAAATKDGIVIRFDTRGHLSLGEQLITGKAKSSAKLQLRRALEAGVELFEQQLALHPDLFRAGTTFCEIRTGIVRFPVLPVDAPDPEGLFLSLFETVRRSEELPSTLTAPLGEALQKDKIEEALRLLKPPESTRPEEEKRSVRLLLTDLRRNICRLKDQLLDRFDAPDDDEVTHPVDSSEILKIAMLSEGAPGTRSEIEGEKAYILVDEFLLGRDANKADFHLDDKSCGRIHARILRRRELFFLEDLGSKNGTYLDGQRLPKHREILLPDSCKLTFGNLAYFFTAE
jgi:hypothetical protein